MEDAVSTTIGTGDFKNGSTATTEYTFDTNGNVTADKNKGIDSVKYNDLGKVVRVKFSDGHFLTYKYDAAGTKLTMKNYSTSGTLTTTTDYMGGFMYVNSALSFFSSPEGRVVKNGTNFEYQYSISDHQGNTRVLFTSATPSATTITATFEGDANDNSSLFTNVANIVSFTAANHTAGGSKVTRLNQAYPVGPAKSLKVYPGDKIDMNVWTYYENNTGFGTNSTGLTPMITAIAGAFGGVSGASGESGNIFNGVNSALGGFGLGGNAGDAAPAAYINYILYDKNYKVLNMGWTRVPSSAYFSKQQISISQVSVTEAGYIFIYLSYEDQSNNYVEFDDFQVIYTPGPVIQANEYYPFGLQTANSWTRDNATANNFLGNGGTELNATTSLYDLDYRNYDPALARMNQVDPMADKYSSLSSYNYAFNNPASFNDINGADPNPSYKPLMSHWSQDFAESWMGDVPGAGYIRNHQIAYAMLTGSGTPGGCGIFMYGDSYWAGWVESADPRNYNPTYASEIADRARNGDAGAIQTYAQMYGDSFTGTIALINGKNSWEADFANGNLIGSHRFQVASEGESIANSDPYRINSVPLSQMIASCPECEWAKQAFKGFWNSNVMRELIPDNITLEINWGAATIVGGNATFTLNLLTRGQDPGFHLTTTLQQSYGLELNAGINLGLYRSAATADQITAASLLGLTRTWSAGYFYGGSYTTGYSDPNASINAAPLWSGISGGYGATFGGSYSTGFTTSGWAPWFK